MKWERLNYEEWKAKGISGEFNLWKSGRRWTGSYREYNGCKFFTLPYGSLKKIKEQCENNYYWE